MAKKEKKSKKDEVAVVKYDEKAYPALLSKCRDTILRVESNMLGGYWELGEHANELKGKERARYGDKTIESLADDLEMSRSSLYYASQFNRKFTKDELSNALDKGLRWRHVTLLLGVSDKKQMLLLAEKTSQQELTSDQLKAEVDGLKKKGKKKGGRKKEYGFCVFYNRLSKTAEWLDDEFVNAFEAGDAKVKKTDVKKLEALHQRIGSILEKIGD